MINYSFLNPIIHKEQLSVSFDCPLNFFEPGKGDVMIVTHNIPLDVSKSSDYDIETLISNQIDPETKVNFVRQADLNSVSAISDNLGTEFAKQFNESKSKS